MKFRLSTILSLVSAALLASGCMWQEKMGTLADSIKLSPESIATSSTGETVLVTVNANCDWQAASGAEWVKIYPDKGTRATKTLTVVIAPCEGDAARETDITLTGASASASVHVTQAQFDKTAIINADTFKDFLNNAGAIAEGETYKLEADIDLAGAVLTPAGSFAGVLEGNGHKVYNYKVESTAENSALILKNTGTIRNIIFGSSDGSKYDNASTVGFAESVTATNFVGGVVAENAGTLQNVTNFARVISPLGTTALSGIGGIAAMTQLASTIDGCVNCADIQASGATAAETYIAGIIAYVNTPDAVISNCVNKADLTVNMKISKASMFGGIVGRANLGAKVQKCTNEGVIKYETKEAPANYIMIAGIAGALYTGSECTDCVNKGEVTSDLQQVNRMGGIVGTLNSGGLISGCVNNANVSLKQAEPNANWEAVAGICGFQEKGSSNVIKGNTNNGKVSVSVNNTTTHANKVAAAGIIGTAALGLEVSNNINKGDVTIDNAGTAPAYAGGIAGFLRAGADIFTSANENSGSVTVNSTGAAGGIVGNSAVKTNTHTGDSNTGAVVCSTAAGSVAGLNIGSIVDAYAGGTVNGVKVTTANMNSLVQGAGSTGTATGTKAPEGSSKGLKSASDLEAFAAAASAASPDFSQWLENGEVNIVSDIDASSLSCFPIDSLPAGVVLNGNGKTVKLNIKSDALSVAMFKSLAGTVKDLVLDGSVETTYAGAEEWRVAALAANVYGGASIQGCTSKVSVLANAATGSATTKYGYVAAFAARVTGPEKVTLTKCTNAGNITVSGTNCCITGGLVGYFVKSAGFTPEMTDCANTGKLTMDHSGGNWDYTGGVVGKVGDSKEAEGFTFTMTDCRNSGELIVNKAPKTRGGAIFGSCGVLSYNISGNTFSGKVTVNSTEAVDRVLSGCAPGFSEAAATGTIKNCTFSGTITAPEDGGNYYFGGIYGNNGAATVSIEGCTTTAASKIYAGSKPKSVGMIAARPNKAGFTIRNCKIGGTINKGEGDVVISEATLEPWMIYGSATTVDITSEGNTAL